MPDKEKEKDEQQEKPQPEVRPSRPTMTDEVGPRMTATELLVKAMESFSELEPENAVVVYRGGCGCVVVHANMPPLEALGLVEVAKVTIVQGMLRHDHEGDGEE